jgi:hypothetical protein
VPRQTSEIFIGYSLFSSSASKVGLIQIRSDSFFSRLRSVRTEKRTCCLSSHFLPDILMVESAENRTEYLPAISSVRRCRLYCLPRKHGGPVAPQKLPTSNLRPRSIVTLQSPGKSAFFFWFGYVLTAKGFEPGGILTNHKPDSFHSLRPLTHIRVFGHYGVHATLARAVSGITRSAAPP